MNVPNARTRHLVVAGSIHELEERFGGGRRKLESTRETYRA